MSDDLVKRLRAAAKHPMMDNNCKADVFDVADAADRIEELESKLAKLVELVEEAYAEGFAEGHVGGWIEGDYSKPWKKSALFTTLAELSSAMKGQDDE